MSIRWTLEDYLVALEHQLKGQYMQSANSKIGFFVVVLQKQRRWNLSSGGTVDFSGLLDILAEKARDFQTADTALFLRVVGINATPKEDFRAIIAANKAKAKVPPQFADQAGNTWSGRGRRPQWMGRYGSRAQAGRVPDCEGIRPLLTIAPRTCEFRRAGLQLRPDPFSLRLTTTKCWRRISAPLPIGGSSPVAGAAAVAAQGPLSDSFADVRCSCFRSERRWRTSCVIRLASLA